MPTLPGSTDTLSAEAKAKRELVTSLLDAHFNLTNSLSDAEAKLVARRDAAVKEFAKANGVDAIIAVSKNVSVALDQLKKDIAALKQSPKLVNECLEQMEKNAPDILKAVLEERKAKDEAELKTRTTGQQVFIKHLEFVNERLKKVSSPKLSAKKESAKKGPVKKGPVKKGPVKKGPVKKGPVKKGPVKKK